jgi:hypothetical protein
MPDHQMCMLRHRTLNLRMISRSLALAVFALSAALNPQQTRADMRCCMAEPKILLDGTFKYSGIPFRLTRPATAIQGFAPFTPASPSQPAAPTLNAPAPLGAPQGPRADFAAAPMQAPGAPSR